MPIKILKMQLIKINIILYFYQSDKQAVNYGPKLSKMFKNIKKIEELKKKMTEANEQEKV